MKKLAAVCAALGALAAGVFWLLQSSWLSRQAETRFVQELTQATGAEVSLDGFRFDWQTMRLSAGPVTLRGTEAADLDPLLKIDRVEIGLQVESFLHRNVRVASLILTKPVASIYVAPDGTTNLPGPRNDRPVPEALLDLAIGEFEARDGELRWDDKRVPIDIRAGGVAAGITFDASSSVYRGTLSASRVAGALLPIEFAGAFTLSAGQLDITSTTVKTPKSVMQANGTVRDWAAPRAELRMEIDADAAEVAQAAKRPEIKSGKIQANLNAAVTSGEPWTVTGTARASQMLLAIGGETYSNVAGESKVTARPGATLFEDLVLRALGGEFRGEVAVLADRFRARGNVKNIEIPGDLSARVSGSVKAEGSLAGIESGSASLNLVPSSGPVPVSGSLDADYAGGNAVVRRSSLYFGESEVNLSGSIDRGLAVRVRSSDANQLLPALRLISSEAPSTFPFSFEGQAAEFDGIVTGSVDKPRIAGKITAAQLKMSEETLTAVSADIEATEDFLGIKKASLERKGARIDAAGTVRLDNWRVTDGSGITGTVLVDRAQLSDLASEFFPDLIAISGTGAGSFTVAGTVGNPKMSGTARADRVEVRGEKFDRMSLQLDASKNSVQLRNVEAARGPDRIRGAGQWTPTAASARFETQGWNLTRSNPLGETIRVQGTGTTAAVKRNGLWQVVDLTGAAQIRSASSGEADIKAVTTGETVNLKGAVSVWGASFDLDSNWRLEPGMPGGGSVRVVSLTQAALERAVGLSNGKQLPFEANIAGTGKFSGKLLEPDRLAGQVQLSLLRLTPRQQQLPAGITAADLTLRNEGPVVLAVAPSGLVIERARFTAKETELEATGNVALRRIDQMNLLVRGRVNLAVLDALNRDFVAAGLSSLNLRVRGPLNQPRLDGRLSFTNAAFSFVGAPNGLDRVNGTILFDRNRASIESMQGQSGGGTVALSGFVGFGSELTYQLQTNLNEVRIRYPEGVSTQANASVVLTGTARRGLLSGEITVLRSGLTPATDVGGLLAKPSAPSIVATAENEFLKGLQLDLRVETAQSAQFSTELTKNVEADVDLRVRGTVLRPIVLGRVSVTQGTIQFFGTDYSINRGEVSFVNPVTVEPQVDLDLETRVRGIAVSISFAGPLNRMSMSYRSDPPLQSSEILALLAVGRTPTSASTLGFSSVRGNNLLSAGGTAVLSSALSQPSAGGAQLQRLFGVTRLKIDPQLIGLDNTPQSRLSFEQPISRDVTVTYSQTLARAQGQLVRVQWDLNRQWSALATRDENGILAIDFVFRKSFK